MKNRNNNGNLPGILDPDVEEQVDKRYPKLPDTEPLKARIQQMNKRSKYRLMLQNPTRFRKQVSERQVRYRARHLVANRIYMNRYWKQYYRKNKLIHYIRTLVASMKVTIKRCERLGLIPQFEDRNQDIYDSLKQIGWSVDTDKHLNHIVSIKHIHDFCPNLPIECYFNVNNIELIDKKDNHTARNRMVSDKVLHVARILEREYEELNGFYDWLKQKEGEVI